MDCRQFRKNHTPFLDDLLPGIDMVAMQRHLGECEACARHDVLVRRSLLVFRNMSLIQPSAEFRERLKARLQMASPMEQAFPGERTMGVTSYLAVAAAVITIGFMSAVVIDRGEAGAMPLLAPAVAYEPEPVRPAIAAPAIMASVSTGMPMWPAMLMLDQAPVQFANSQFQLAAWGR